MAGFMTLAKQEFFSISFHISTTSSLSFTLMEALPLSVLVVSFLLVCPIQFLFLLHARKPLLCSRKQQFPSAENYFLAT
jgi:hypothetical protein